MWANKWPVNGRSPQAFKGTALRHRRHSWSRKTRAIKYVWNAIFNIHQCNSMNVFQKTRNRWKTFCTTLICENSYKRSTAPRTGWKPYEWEWWSRCSSNSLTSAWRWWNLPRKWITKPSIFYKTHFGIIFFIFSSIKLCTNKYSLV